MRLLAEALKDLRAHRGRSLLSALSLFLGIIALVGVCTASSVVRDVFLADAEQHYGRQVTVGTVLAGNGMTDKSPLAAVASLDRRVTAAGGAYLATIQLPVQISGPQLAAQPQLATLVAGEPDGVKRLPLLAGRWFPRDARAAYPGGVVVNKAGAAVFGPPGSLVDLQFGTSFQPLPQRVVGVVADGGTAPAVYLSLTGTLALRPGCLPPGWSLSLLVHDRTAGEAVLRAVVGDVGTDLGIDPGDLDIHRADTVADLDGSLNVTRAAFLGIAAGTLAVAVIGLLNIGFATVRDRRRELTIRRAVGATRARMFGLVLLASVLVAVAAAVLAVGVAVIAVLLVVPHLIHPDSAVSAPGFPMDAALVAVLAALGAALVAGIAPAISAARVDMAFVLRE